MWVIFLVKNTGNMAGEDVEKTTSGIPAAVFVEDVDE